MEADEEKRRALVGRSKENWRKTGCGQSSFTPGINSGRTHSNGKRGHRRSFDETAGPAAYEKLKCVSGAAIDAPVRASARESRCSKGRNPPAGAAAARARHRERAARSGSP